MDFYVKYGYNSNEGQERYIFLTFVMQRSKGLSAEFHMEVYLI